jgi:hypothetical protein
VNFLPDKKDPIKNAIWAALLVGLVTWFFNRKKVAK